MRFWSFVTLSSLTAGWLSAAVPAVKVENRTALPGAGNVPVSILADTDQPVDAVAVSAAYAAELTFMDATIEGTALGPGNLDAEWFDVKEEPGVNFSVAAVIDIYTPYEGRTLPPGNDHHIVTVFFDVATGLTAGHRLPITLLERANDPPILTVFTVAGETVIPERVSGRITVVEPPKIAAVSPRRGPVSGGTALTITGNHFTDDITVTIAGLDLLDLTVESTTTISGTTPPHAAGAVPLVVVNTLGGDMLGSGFTYLNPPEVTSVTPDLGNGAMSVTITGANFTDLADTGVTFDGAAVTEVTSVTSTEIACRLPSCGATLGPVDVAVTTSGGTDVLVDAFTCAITFRRGDGNCDGGVNLADAIRVLDYLFSDAGAPCIDALDSNDDGMPDLSDAVYVIRHLFGGSAPPPAPFPGLGIDPTEDTNDCAAQCGS